jgi:hypothetical protein
MSSAGAVRFRAEAKAFVQNMGRADALLRVPCYLIGVTAEWQGHVDTATVRLLGTLERNKDEFDRRQGEIAELAKQLMGDRIPVTAETEAFGVAQAGTIAFTMGNTGDAFMESLFYHWTAFETLATDLWVEAVNRRPDLAAAAMRAQQKKPGDADSAGGSRPEGKSIRLDDLAKHKFDMSRVMGTVLRDTRRFVFNRLGDIQSAYVAAFGQAAKTVFAGTIFQTISCLEALRNVIVHHGGIVDAPFRARVSGDAWFSRLVENEKVWVNGKDVSNFASAVVQFSISLLSSVNEYFEEHPE